MPDNPALMLAAIGTAGAACQWPAWRTRLPAILFLLLTGILVGPVSGLLEPDALLGDLLFPLISLWVAVILFEGSLTLRLKEVRGLEQVVRRLVGTGSLISGGTAALAAHWLVGFDWPLATLFAVEPQERLHLYTAEESPQPGPGWTILSMMPEAYSVEQAGEKPSAGDRDNHMSETTGEAAE